jgi:hypothetical protein
MKSDKVIRGNISPKKTKTVSYFATMANCKEALQRRYLLSDIFIVMLPYLLPPKSISEDSPYGVPF